MARLDRDTFDRLVRQQHGAVYRSALRVVRNERDAEDVAQEVFLRALRGKVPPAGEEPPRAALCWLATRLALNVLRGGRRRQHQEQHMVIPEAPITPAQTAEASELQQTLRTHVQQLPDALRLPLLLRYQDGLTLKAVGSALAISESTAHDRVQQAIEKLRRVLASAGFAIAPLQVPDLLASPQVPGVPPGLEGRLLGLADAAPVAAATMKAAALAVLLSGAAAVVWMVASPGASAKPEEPRSTATAPAAVRASVAQRPEAADLAALRTPVRDPAVAPPQDPAPDHATFTGTVHDALRWPAAGATVAAMAAGGYKHFELAHATIDKSGAFSLDVPFRGEPVPVTRICLQIRDQSVLLLETDELALTVEAAKTPLHLLLPASAGAETTRFEIVCMVRGADGAPLCGVPVQLSSHGSEGEQHPGWSSDCEATTGADGTALLSGRTPGRKLLFADGRKLGLRPAVATIDVAEPGAYRNTFTLTAGNSLQAHVGTVDGSPLTWANVWLEDEVTHVTDQAEFGSDGGVAFHDLGDGPFTLRAQSSGFSGAMLQGLRPGAQPVEVRLKRTDDVQDHGDHLAEVHGRLVDAVTGEVVPVGPFAVEVLPVWDGDSTLLLDRVQPPPPAQRMSDGAMRQAFHDTGLAAGKWAIVARADGYAVAVEFVDLREREVRSGIDVRLQRGAEVSGRVLDHDGKPVAKAMLSVAGFGSRADRLLAAHDQPAQEREHNGSGGMIACWTHTEADGTFTLGLVPPGQPLRVVAEVQGGGRTESTALDLRPGEARGGLELRLPAR